MPNYTVHHRYTAVRDGQRFGPWVEGDAVQLTEDEADWVNRDSAGCLIEVVPVEVAKDGKTGPNRQHKPANNRAGR